MPRLPDVLRALTLTALVAVAFALTTVSAPAPGAGPDRLVVPAAVWALRAATGYLLQCAGVVAAGVMTGRRRRLPGTPRWLVRAVDLALATHLLVGGGTAAVLADEGVGGRSADGCAVDLPPLGWPTGRAPGPAGTATHVVVRAGDSLWSSAADALGGTARPSGVAAEWPRWWQRNRSVIGPDPDLLSPGQRLAAPPTITRSGR
jgi:nucleoid-associated protein YgaU